MLLGGADETPETNRVFSYMNLARAFAELDTGGAELYCLHRNRWWQTSRGPLLDAGAFVAGLEYAAGVQAILLGRPSPSYFAAAVEALDAEPEDDVDGRRRRRGRRGRCAMGVGMRAVLVRTGESRRRGRDRQGSARRDRELDRRPPRLAGARVASERRSRRDRDRAHRRALERPGFRERCFTEAGAPVLRLEGEPGAAPTLPASQERRRSARPSARASTSRGARSRSRAAEARESCSRADEGVCRAGRGGSDRLVHDAFAGARRSRLRCRRRPGPSEPLYTADELKAAEAGHDVDALMERAARAVADAVIERFPAARRIRAVCGKGSNGGDGRIAVRMLRESGLDAEESSDLEGADVVVDALFGTGFTGDPRPETADLIRRMNDTATPVVAVDIRPRGRRLVGGGAGGGGRGRADGDDARAKVGLAVGPGCRERATSCRRHRSRAAPDPARARRRRVVARVPPKRDARQQVHGRIRFWSSAGSRGMTGAAALRRALRCRADAGYVAVAAPAESLPCSSRCVCRGGQAAARRRPRGRREGAALASGPGLGGARGARARSATAARGRICPQSSTPTGSTGLARSCGRSTRRCSRRTRASSRGCSAAKSEWVDAHRLEALERAVRAVRLRGACWRPGHARRSSGGGRLGRRRQRARAGDRGDG